MQRRRFQAGLLQCTVEWRTGGYFRKTIARPEQPGQSRLQQPELHRRQAAASLAHWLPVRQRVTYKLAVLTHKVRTAATPTYLSELVPAHHLGLCTLPMLRHSSFLANTPNWPVALFLLLIHPPGTLYLLTFDYAKTFSLSNATWKMKTHLFKLT